MEISVKYSDFADIFFPDLVSEFFKHTGISDYAIKLVDSQQPSYKPIYNLELVELKTLKTFININLAHKFIKSSKLSVSTLIIFNQKSNGSF